MRALWLLPLCLLAANTFAAAPAGSWWNTGYTYRQQIAIPAGATTLPTHYSVAVIFDHAAQVSAMPSRSQADGDDVRIVRWSSATSTWVELDRIVDPSSAWNTSSTRLWFRTASSIAANTTDDDYYIYFSNPAAITPPANADNIFLFYDDFSSGISNARWDTDNGVHHDNGMMRLTPNASATSRTSFLYNTIWETRARVTSTYGDFNLWGASAESPFVAPLLMFQADGDSYQALAYTDSRPFSPVNPTQLQNYSFTREGTDIAHFLINGAQVAAFTSSGGAASNLYVAVSNEARGGQMYYDWVRIRPYRNPDPSLNLNGLEAYAPTAAANSLQITHDRSGINCVAEPITVQVLDSSGNALTNYSSQVTLRTTNTSGAGNRGNWSLAAGQPGTLNNGFDNDGEATFTWPSGYSSITFLLSYPEGPREVNIDAFQTSNTAINDGATGNHLTFTQNGFSIISTAVADPTAIGPFAPQTAGDVFDVHITAYGQTPTDPQCGVIEAYDGDKNLKLWFSRANPTGGSRAIQIVSPSSLMLATSEPAGTNAMVRFAEGRAFVRAKYKDVGALLLHAKDPAEPDAATAGQASFVVKPAYFAIEGRSNGNRPNPAAASASDGWFAKAGELFSLTLEARDLDHDITPNFGRETPAEAVTLSVAAALPSGPLVQNLVGPLQFTQFEEGRREQTGYRWDEVGIIRVTPRISDGSYLTAGDVTTEARNLGRFIPASFGIEPNTPLLRAGCGQFTYIGQPFTYFIAPVLTLTPLTVSGQPVLNYTADLMKLTHGDTTVRDRTYLATAGSANMPLTIAGISGADPAIVPVGNGKVQLLFQAGSGLNFNRGAAPQAPFDPSITIEVKIADADGVMPVDGTEDETIGPIPFQDNHSTQRYGRLAFRNAVGSELLDLPLMFRTEFFQSNTAGFVASTSDSCTTGVKLRFNGGTLADSLTCVLDTGSPGASDIGCLVASGPNRYRSPTENGNFNLILRAPGQGNRGTKIVSPESASIPAWLLFDWDATATDIQHPSGIATFGIYSGVSSRRIYQREDIVR